MFWNWLWWWLQDSMNILKAIELYIFKNYYILYIFNWRIIALHYCLGYAMYQHESAIDIHMFPPSWTSLSLPILWMSEFMASGYLNKTVKKKPPKNPNWNQNNYAAESTVEARGSLSSPVSILPTAPCSVMAPTPGCSPTSRCPAFPISYVRRSGVGSGKQ